MTTLAANPDLHLKRPVYDATPRNLPSRGGAPGASEQIGARLRAWMWRLPLLVLGLGFAGCAAIASAQAPAEPMVTYRGATMGTSYLVKLYDPPASLDEEIALEIDAELRRVNAQMSTYLKSSEISRFNRSRSTDWFDVSEQTASVVEFALSVSEKTGGAFDVTVGPLVNLWGFGPEERTNSVPPDSEVEKRLKQVGYRHLEVRRTPPAIRKALPELQIDLSAIAKGHGVDRVVELLNASGATDVFVEIGGEVRVTGDKAGTPWVVGIQRPDAATMSLLARHPLRDQSMATSGDYHNRFEADGRYFSHTIDPATGRPVTHRLASVTVLAETCMMADAWATAIDVLGPERGLKSARENGLEVLLVTRDGDGDGFHLAGTGSLSQYADASSVDAAGSEASEEAGATEATSSRWLPVLALTLLAFGVVLAAMAVGVIFGRRPISGSCGGIAGTKNDDGSTQCSLCTNPAEACKELRGRIEEGAPH